MAIYNQQPKGTLDQLYNRGYLPQRNNASLFYHDTSCRANLAKYCLSSENKRILKKTATFRFHTCKLADFSYTPTVQKTIKQWTSIQGWTFPVASVKLVFTNHIFNTLHTITDKATATPIVYAISLFTPRFSHLAYLFFDPSYQSNLPIKTLLEFVALSYNKKLHYAYLGGFAYYKRTMPGFEVYTKQGWVTYSSKHT